MSEEKIHSEIGASGSSRWLACIASVPLSRPYPNTTNAAAEEGTRLHELAEDVMNAKVKLADCTEDDVDMISEYLDVCHELASKAIAEKYNGGFYAIELEVPLWYDEGFVGYIDFCAYIPSTATLHIVDYKSGRLYVDERSTQNAIYAAAYVESLGLWEKVKRVESHIVQPRTSPAHRSFPRTPKDLLLFKLNIVDETVTRIRRVIEIYETEQQVPTAAYAIGESQCRFCSHAPNCAPLQAAVQRLAVQGMQDLILVDRPEAEYFEELGDEFIAEILDNTALIKQYLTAVERYAMRNVERFPVWEVVNTLGNRTWLDPTAAAAYIETLGGEPYKEVIVSPSGFEKMKIEGTKPKQRKDYAASVTTRKQGDPKLVRKKIDNSN